MITPDYGNLAHTELTSPPGYASAASSRMNGVVFLVQKEHWYQYLRISAGGAHGQCKRLPESPCPPRAQDKYCRSTEKRESSRPSALNGCVRVFINDILGPQGGPHCRHQNGKGLLTQPQQGIEHRSSIFRSRTFAPAPSAVYMMYVYVPCKYINIHLD